MANFKTHVSVALSASSLAAAVAINGGLYDAAQSAWYISMGVVGGMLPDIDASNSRPFKHLFMVLATGCGFLTYLALKNLVTEQTLMLTTLAVFLIVRYPSAHLFQKMTLHRGVFHSLLAGVFFGALLVCIRHYLLGAPSMDAWLSGIFLLLGFVVHLCLDELFSVDLCNGRMKKSFGTALKLYGYQNIPGSLLMLSLTAGLLILSPSSATLRKALNQVNWSNATEFPTRLQKTLKSRLD